MSTAIINGKTVELQLLGGDDDLDYGLESLEIPTDSSRSTSPTTSPPTIAASSTENVHQLVGAPTDRFGFYLGGDDGESYHKCLPVPPSVLKQRNVKEKERLQKWLDMKKAWAGGGAQRKVKERCRKGIPDGVREWAWYNISAAKESAKRYPTTAAVLTPAALRAMSSATLEDIERDVPRTFPSHKLFHAGDGQGALRRVLQCYAIHDPVVGYCQVRGRR